MIHDCLVLLNGRAQKRDPPATDVQSMRGETVASEMVGYLDTLTSKLLAEASENLKIFNFEAKAVFRNRSFRD